MALTDSEGSLAPSPSVAVARKGKQRLFLKFGPIKAFGGSQHLLCIIRGGGEPQDMPHYELNRALSETICVKGSGGCLAQSSCSGSGSLSSSLGRRRKGDLRGSPRVEGAVISATSQGLRDSARGGPASHFSRPALLPPTPPPPPPGLRHPLRKLQGPCSQPGHM